MESQNDEIRAAWDSYVARLQEDDPEEYAALIRDLQTSMGEDQPEANFSPSLPGGKNVLGQEGVEQRKESVELVPLPSFVMKTKDVNSGGKVFVNICSSALIQKTSMKKQLMEDGQEQEGINIPLSLGPARTDKDKAGRSCTVYDIVVHPDVLSDADADKTGQSRTFLCELAIQYVETKYKCSLDPKFKLPRMTYKGDAKNPPRQLIRKQTAPIIEEVSDARCAQMNTVRESATPSTSPPDQAKVSNAEKLGQRHADPAKKSVSVENIAFSIHCQMDDGSERPCEAVISDPGAAPVGANTRTCSLLVVRMCLPKYVPIDDTAGDIELSLSPEYLVLKLPSCSYHPLELFLPYAVSVAEAKSSFETSTCTLRVDLPLLPEASVTGNPDVGAESCDPGSRPWLLALALTDETRGTGPPAKATPLESCTASNVKIIDEDGILPEDRFHKADIVSQHIKDERVKQRIDKSREWDEKQSEKQKVESSEQQRASQALIEAAEAEVASEAKDQNAKSNVLNDLELF